MCGRFDQNDSWEFLAPYIPIKRVPEIEFTPRPNIRPTDPVIAIMDMKGQLAVQFMRWGIVPSWWNKPFKEAPTVFNARAETVGEKPMFRTGYQKRRGLLPVSAYYEWKTIEGRKVPHKISAAGNSPLLAACVYDLWDFEGDILVSCAMLTCEANEQLAEIHARMPVFLDKDASLKWVYDDYKRVSLTPSLENFRIERLEKV